MLCKFAREMMIKRLFAAMVALLWAGVATAAGGDADAWITHPQATATPVVLQFRREVQLDVVPAQLPVEVTADSRFILSVNGQVVARGPSTGTLQRWRKTRVDLAPYLSRHNRIEAVVWNFGKFAPLAQQSLATGFRLTGADFATDVPGWQVRIDVRHSAESGSEQLQPEYYVASAPETIDSRLPLADWVDAVSAPAAAGRTLIPDPLPPQRIVAASPGQVVRASLAAGQFPHASLVIPAHTSGYLLIRREAMASSYTALATSGGRDARVKVTYAEALYDADGNKGDRNLVGDLEPRGIHDTFVANGKRESFSTLWWRTWRFLKLEIVTADEPLILDSLHVVDTGYPFDQVGRFVSNDPQLNRIFDIGWRTLRVDAHETFMDSSFWEQLQYAGDTRLQMLISYAVSGDPQLALQAIDVFAESNVSGGLVEGAYPSRSSNVITTFSLSWIAMLHDWLLEQPDHAPIRRHLPRMREVLAWYEKLRTPQGLLGANPHWNFIDWSGQRWDDRTIFPSYGKGGGSCLMTVLWLGALKQAAALETAQGEVLQAKTYRAQATAARAAIRSQCWNPQRGLYADNPDFKVRGSEKYSQHMNALAVLYDVANKDEAQGVLERITVPGRGVDSPPEMFAMTYYFAWHLVRAYDHVGLGRHYHSLLQTWRELLALNYTTWPESRGKTRSDTHAWSAHPTADLLRIVAGIRSDAPGYSRLRIAPELGPLTQLDAAAATPHGPVSVRYRRSKGRLQVDIQSPEGLPGQFVWRGKTYPLQGERTRMSLRDDSR
ncbi:MAG: hypothetical protein JNL93_24775 [Pelomonas sp.]|nr:hypothetical protein [Roseateles sp.]